MNKSSVRLKAGKAAPWRSHIQWYDKRVNADEQMYFLVRAFPPDEGIRKSSEWTGWVSGLLIDRVMANGNEHYPVFQIFRLSAPTRDGLFDVAIQEARRRHERDGYK